MKLSKVISLIHGQSIHHSFDGECDIKGGCGADLMSDVLASIQPEFDLAHRLM